jgi:hypothetical protein
MRAGVWCAGGSDAPVESCSPWAGLYDAMFRARRGPEPDSGGEGGGEEADPSIAGGVFRAEECLSFAEALWTYTQGGAFAGDCEGSLGRIEDGAAGDFVIVDPLVARAGEDPLCRPLLRDCVPDVVCVGGEVVRVSDSSRVPIAATAQAPQRHRGLRKSGDSPPAPVTMGGPYIPGKNGHFGSRPQGLSTTTPDHNPATASTSARRGAGGNKGGGAKARPALLCAEVSHSPTGAAAGAGAGAGTGAGAGGSAMFAGRPAGSCVCLLTGRWLQHGGGGADCGMALRDASSRPNTKHI